MNIALPDIYLKGKSQNYNKRKNPKVRSSRPNVFCKKGVLRNFAKFTGVFL